ncbi:hypothetical protein [Paenibacillus sp. BC26]|uniref:hypothetical protein n=1 Tax=Paenibacillus sp. BC26 TaxID=1881032 RepID=UPI0008F23847|nr:hypothetical protein [Paenibacillus sp. BC26]SFS77246.1 hypothetical protein SAMN05428962_2774 [Paenibacillus sp. BC26]
MEVKPIETELGILLGRDCIFLDEINHIYNSATIELSGEVNGNLATNGKKDTWIKYKIKLTGIYYFNMIELDVSSKYIDNQYKSVSSLTEVVKSD